MVFEYLGKDLVNADDDCMKTIQGKQSLISSIFHKFSKVSKIPRKVLAHISDRWDYHIFLNFKKNIEGLANSKLGR